MVMGRRSTSFSQGQGELYGGDVADDDDVLPTTQQAHLTSAGNSIDERRRRRRWQMATVIRTKAGDFSMRKLLGKSTMLMRRNEELSPSFLEHRIHK